MSNKKPKKVGRRVPEVLTAMEQAGPTTSWKLAKLLLGLDPKNVGKYASRAVGLGLAMVDRTNGSAVFTCVPGWQELVAERAQVALPAMGSKPKNFKLHEAAVWVPGIVPVFVRAPNALPSAHELHPLYTVWR